MRFTAFFLAGIFILSNPASAAVMQSSLEDQQSVELTVYNSNLGLVKDVRSVKLPKGQGELRFMDVAASINPVSVHARALSKPENFQILDQNYEYDLMSEQKLLDKYVGKKIKVQQWSQDLNRIEEKEAVLLSNNQGQIFQINNEIFLGYPGTRVLPSLPQDLIAKPTLTWNFVSKTDKAQQLEVSYLTGDIFWKADYIVTLAEDDRALDLSGWVTIDNHSGAAYRNARLKLIAGEVNRVETPAPYAARNMMMKEAMMADAGGAQFQEKAFFEYHIYDLQRKVTIKDNQTKQINLLEVPGISAEKELTTGGGYPAFYYAQPGQPQKLDVNVTVKFKNSKENGAGMPLPAGVLRVYKKDSDASLQFVGEDRIEHTPKNEEVRVKIGKAFDVVAERVQKDYAQISQHVHESEWEITVRNHKKEPVTVGILESLSGDWKVLKNSHDYKKVDASTLRFDVTAAPEKEEKVTYRVRVTV